MESYRKMRKSQYTARHFFAFITALAVNTSLLANPIDHYEIDDSILKPTISECDAISEDNKSINQLFNTAVCRYHVIKEMNNSIETRTIIDTTIELIRKLQIRGLTSGRQALANLIEGLLHCRLASIELGAKTNENQKSILFCESRKAALSHLASISWTNSNINYKNPDKKMNTFVDAVGACYIKDSGPLNSQYSSSCGIINSLTKEEIKAIVDKIYKGEPSKDEDGKFEGGLYKKYFGSTGPITAIFKRKKDLADTVIKSSTTEIDNLTTQSKKIESVYTELSSWLKTNVFDKITPLVNAYKSTLSFARATLNTFDSWRSGLFVSKEEGELRYDYELAGINVDGTGGKAKLLQDQIERFSGPDGYISVINSLEKAFSKIAEDKNNSKIIAHQLCQILYCEVAVEPYDSYIIGWPYDDACLSQLNGLCPDQEVVLMNGSAFTAAKFCQDVGFTDTIIGMSEEEGRTCFSGGVQ